MFFFIVELICCHSIVLHFKEAALDADKVYLAAIDKFDAMVSKSNAYTPDGMLPSIASYNLNWITLS